MLKNPYYLYGSNDIAIPARINFGEFLLSKLWEYQDRVALINGESEESITYRQIAEEGMHLALSLVRIGVRKGDVVGLCSENRQEFWPTIVGVACAGAVTTTFNTSYTKDELKHVASISKPKYIFCSPKAYDQHKQTFASLKHVKKIIVYGEEMHRNVLSYKDLVRGIPDGKGGMRRVEFEEFLAVDVQGHEDTLFILYSSGTTGLPKGVMLTHLNLLAMCIQTDEYDPKNKMLVITPWYHVMGLAGCITYLTAGRTVVYLPRFEPGIYLRTIEKYQIYYLAVVPSLLITLTKFPSNHDVGSVRVIFSGSAPLRADTISAVCKKFPNVDTVRQGYGMTESTLSVARSYIHEMPKIGSVGRINKAVIVKIVDTATKKPVGKYQEGEIRIKGPLVMKGYVGKDRSEDFDEEDFFRTGDIGYYDEEGVLFVVGRLKELIKYKGYQVPPAEIEAVLLQHPDIRDAGVIGVTHADVGEVPLACVVSQPGATLTQDMVTQFVAEKHHSVRDAGVIGVPHADVGEVPLACVVPQSGATLTQDMVTQFVAEKLSNPKHLRGGVIFVSEIPKNASGKILRHRLRDMVKARKSKL